MKRLTRRRNSAGLAMALVTFTLGATLAVVVAGSASADTPLSSTTTSTTTSTPSGTTPMSGGIGLDPKAGRFSVINGTVNATSDHAIIASSAFPNYTTGAVDNYYSLSHAHLDNSPFAEGTASPADTGPIGQTAAAGNFQQTQYADARWPGGPENATFGSQGAPFATADAGNYIALANASEPSRSLTGPKLSMPKGFNNKLQSALAQWKKKWGSVLGIVPPPPAKPPKSVTTPVTTVSTPKPSAPSAPTVTVTTPVGTVKTPAVPAPPKAPGVPGATAAGAPRSVASASAPKTPQPPKALKAPKSPKTSGDGESLLTSSTQAALVPVDGSQTGIPKIDTTNIDTTQTASNITDPAKLKPYSLVMRGESSVGRVKLGGGQIVVDGIHVKAAIANDGTSPNPTYQASISIASASIGGVPVTIDQNGVHVAGHKQDVPYGKASDSLNTALKQAGIQMFLVSPQVTTYSCGQPSTGTDSTSTTTDTSTTSTDQSGMTSSCGMCPPSGTGTDTGSTTTTTSTDPSSAPPPPGTCDAGAGTGCDQSGTGTTTTGTTTTGTTSTTTTPLPSTTTSSTQSTTTSSAPSWCAPSSPPPSSCAPGTASKTTTSTTQTTTTGMSSDPMAPGATPSSGEETVLASGLHVVFTQPVSPSGVPSQYVEHIFGEVFVDSLATLAPPLPKLDLSSPFSSSTCGGKHSHGKTTSGGGSSLTSGGGSSAAGGTSGSGATSGVLGASGSGAGSGSSQLASGSTPGTGSGGGSFPASVVRALHKPLWLLLAYLVWQLLVIGTGYSLWQWRRGRAAA